jgi:hypothetical protein
VPEPFTAEQLTLPEGMKIPDEVRDEFVGLINNTELSAAERANNLLGLHTKILQAAADEHVAAWDALQSEWQGAVQKDFPGDKLTAAQAQIAKVLDRYGDAAVREAFALTGAGNNPAIFRFMTKLAADLNERPPVTGTPATGQPLDRASRMFGTAKE